MKDSFRYNNKKNVFNIIYFELVSQNMTEEIKISDCGNIELNELREICRTIPDVCLNLILEYSYRFAGKLKCLLKGHKIISNVGQLPNRKIISVGDHSTEINELIEDTTIRIWDHKTGKLLLLIDNMEWIRKHLILKNSNICIKDRNGIKIYDTNTGEIISKFSYYAEPRYSFINELSDTRIIFNMDTRDQSKIILLNPMTQVTEIYSTEDNFYNKSLYNKSTLVLPDGKFVGVIKKNFEYKLCLFDPSLGFQTPESIISHKTDPIEDTEIIQLEAISNNRVLFYEYRKFPMIVDFKLKTVKEIDLNKILNLNDCFILKIQLISPSKGLFLITRSDIPGCIFLLLNFDTFDFKLYSTIHDSSSYLTTIFNLILEDQIIYENSSKEIIICDLDTKNSTSINTRKFQHSNAPIGTILNNLNIVIPTQNKGELAIYY